MSTDQLVIFNLAHPLRSIDAEAVGLPIRTYAVGEELKLSYGQAMRLVAGGAVAGANPQKPQTYMLDVPGSALRRAPAKSPEAPALAPEPAASVKPGRKSNGE
ncbi:hypothetical protein ETD86_13015 [Nonomuraea turkmeniaca]|uniref:Uncharacterized protein n=1 Tax=Nonomuraea turkmeniaca TaxID=103838 RepID=A0A5S4FN14_9ACTN|nr:hypothetical protein [Nonomuraea turkmeniaca]TMR22083.1 hypothetical protein ETD86_13015 [Nonomuraea turkmeniaca]